MTTNEFLNTCEESFGGKKYTTGQRAAFEDKLARFGDRELNRIYSDLLETTKYLPKIVDVYESARSIGLLNEPDYRPHEWKPADCNLCGGEGRLAVIWGVTQLAGSSVENVSQMFPYSKSFDYAMKPDEFRSLFRCRCLAGDADTLSKGWPKWSSSVNPMRILSTGPPLRDRAEMKQEFHEMLLQAGMQSFPEIKHEKDHEKRIAELRRQAAQITHPKEPA